MIVILDQGTGIGPEGSQELHCQANESYGEGRTDALN